MIEPLPLARPERSPERRASPLAWNRCKATTVVTPMSNTRSLTE
jgi:hypothetical protein